MLERFREALAARRRAIARIPGKDNILFVRQGRRNEPDRSTSSQTAVERLCNRHPGEHGRRVVINNHGPGECRRGSIHGDRGGHGMLTFRREAMLDEPAELLETVEIPLHRVAHVELIFEVQEKCETQCLIRSTNGAGLASRESPIVAVVADFPLLRSGGAVA